MPRKTVAFSFELRRRTDRFARSCCHYGGVTRLSPLADIDEIR
jgi:hypothetical protein